MSGAKQAREALQGMEDTAKQWKDTAAETFYENSEGLSFFGLSESDFVRDQQSAQDWLDGLLAVWSDGEKESNEIVAHWTDSFKSLTDSYARPNCTALKDTADKNGYTSVSQGLAADIQTLDQMDAEIERLLKKRQNGFFSEKDQIRLQELIDTREAIEVKYHLTPEETGGFETISQKVEAEVARAQARGKTDADTSVYENAVKAAAEGMAAINAQIDERYDKEYGLIQLIEDETERQKALEDLNSRYNDERKAAAQEYAETLSSIVMPVWNQPEIQQASQQMDELFTKLREYSMASESEKPALLADLQALSAGMDEGALDGISLPDDADPVPAGQRHERSRSAGAVPGYRLFYAAGSVRGNRQLSGSHQDRPARLVQHVRRSAARRGAENRHRPRYDRRTGAMG